MTNRPCWHSAGDILSIETGSWITHVFYERGRWHWAAFNRGRENGFIGARLESPAEGYVKRDHARKAAEMMLLDTGLLTGH